MTPLSPLRILLLGTLSWAILIGGIWSLWEWGDRVNFGRSDSQEAVVQEVTLVPAEPAREPTVPGEPAARAGQSETLLVVKQPPLAWPFLVLGLSLIAISFGGFLPTRMFLGRRRADDPVPDHNDPLFIDRPDGTRLCVELHGNPSGPTLIFTHGWSLDQTAWHYAKHQLGPTYRLVLWDLPGLGRSRGPDNQDWSLEKMAHDLDAVVEQTAGEGPVYLVGHSIGGMIAQTYAGLYPHKIGSRIQAILLVHTTYTNPLKTLWGAPLWTALQKPLIEPMNQLMIALAPLAWLSNWQSYLNGSLLITSRITSFTGKQTRGQLDYASWLAARAWPAVVARGNLAMFKFDAQAALPQIEAPMLMVAAKSDRVTQPIAGERIAQLAPHCKLIHVDGGHLGMWEFHDEVMHQIDHFLRSQIEATSMSTAIASDTPVEPPLPLL